MDLTVVICARNPEPNRLARVFAGLLAQDIDPSSWELLIVDNGSREPIVAPVWPAPYSSRVIAENRPGLFYARIAAMAASRAPFLIFIDDDTVPAPSAIGSLHAAFTMDPSITAAGPRIMAEYAVTPPDWLAEFAWALALRDLGSKILTWAVSDGLPIPNFTPIGAGLALRTSALPIYLAHAHEHERAIKARSWIGQGCGGNEDKDIVLTLLRAGGRVAYVPDAILCHLIPSERLTPAYFKKLLPSLNFLWMRTLHAHGLNERRPISRLGCVLRTVRAWLRHRAWKRPANHLRWLSAAGTFRGLAANRSDNFRY